MDQDSCHRVFRPCGHDAAPDPKSHPVPSVSDETTRWSPDPAGALAAGLHIRSVPAGAFAAALHHAAVLHIQLQEWEHVSRHQEEEEVTRNQTKTDLL